MRFKLRHGFTALLMLGFLLLIPLGFQNCAGPLEEESDISSVAETLPFAFDATMDHLAYMSCSTVAAGSDPNSYFTFKAGAYDAGSGIRLRDDFQYAARNLTQSERVDALGQSPENKGAYLQLGVRQNQNFQTLLAPNSSSYAKYLGDLTSSTVATPLVQLFNQNRLNTFSGRPLADQMKYFVSETLATQLRTDLSSGAAVLSLAYGRAAKSPAVAIAPTENSLTNIYGRGFIMNFKLGHGINGTGAMTSFSSGSTRVMYNVQQYNLETGAAEGAWSCPPEWTFMIVRPSNAVGTLCSTYMTEPTPTTAQQAMYTALRKVLPQDEWGVNLNQRCIVPKKAGDCYGGVTNINYAGPNCDPSLNNCPHYITICKKP